MIKKLMHTTAATAGLAALLLTGACASTNDTMADTTDPSDTVVQVTQTESVVPAAGPAKIDSDGNVYSSSAAPGTGNPASVGTNTNVNLITEPSSIRVTETTVTETPVVTPVETTTTVTTTTPMTSSSTVDTTATTQVETETRTRLRKD